MTETTRCSRCGNPLSQSDADRNFQGMCPHCLARAALQDSRPPVETASPATRIQTLVPPLQAGAQFHGLEILEILGYGGMGVVYRARQTSLNRSVALKVLAPQLAASEEFTLRFDREAKVLASLSHPNIVHVYDFGKEGDLLFLSMEHVDGPTLETFLEKKKPVDLVWFLTLIRNVARGLQRVHESGLVHRDVKPANILVAKDGTPKLGDFGLAIETQAALKLTESGMFVGTPHYVSPEHVQGKKVDARSDLYSLGVILYQGIAGRTPFTGPSATAILMKHVQEAPPPLYKFAPQVPSILGEITRKLLAKNPASRHESAVALEKDLDRALEAVQAAPKPVRPPSSPVVTAPPAPAKPLPWMWIGMGAAAAVGVVLFLVALFHEPAQPPPDPTPPPVARPRPAPPTPPMFPPREEPRREPPPLEAPAPAPAQANAQDKRRQLDYYLQIINLCAVSAFYCDARGKTAEAVQLRTTMTETHEKLARLVESMKADGQNPFVDDALLPQDKLTYFEELKIDGETKERIAAAVGTFAAKVKAGSKARVVVVRAGDTREFLLRFDERPKDLNSILQVAGLIPGQTVEGPAEPTAKVPEPRPEQKPESAPKPPESAPDVKPPPAPLPAPASVEPMPAPRRKASPPDAAAQKDIEKQVRDLFKAEYAKKTPSDQAALAQTLMEQGKAGSTDLPTRYMLLREARDLATLAGEIEVAVRAVSAMADTFDIDAPAMKAAALSKFQIKAPDTMVRFCRVYLAVGEEAQAAGSLDALQPIATKADAAARGSGDAGITTQVQTMIKDLTWAAAQATAVKPHQKTLLDKPDDPAANLAVGRFVCLVQGDWPRGSGLLLKSNDALLKAAGQKEIDGASDATAQLNLGDAWWNASEKETQPEVKRRLLKRSYYWYLQAIPSLTGLAKQRAESRLRQGATVMLPAVPQGQPTAIVGGAGGGPFEDLPKPTALLVGFKMIWEGSPTVMTMVQPYYSTNGVTSVAGKIRGGGSGSTQEVQAKPGYAVGGVILRGKTRVNGIKVIFMRVAGATLDPRDTYESEWCGDSGPEAVTLGRSGAYVIGIHGADGNQIDALGIILLKR